MRTVRVACSVACAFGLVVAAAGCGDDATTASSAAEAGAAVTMGQPFPAERCESNRGAGTITYLSGFDFAASASIIDILVAKQKGYYDDLCLDVKIVAGLSTTNYPQVAANEAQFASGGSFSGLATFVHRHDDAHLVALAVEGRSANDTLIVKKGAATTIEDLRGKVIGVKGALPASVRAMLADAGLVKDRDYTVKDLEGFDPTQHIVDPDIVGFAAFRSNEPGQLARAGIAFDELDPSDQDIPGSFGVVYTNAQFLDAHPSAATDFMRATMKGLADAVADPRAASMVAIDFIDNNGNPNHLSSEGEAFRWQTEANLVADTSVSTAPLGLPLPKDLEHEVQAYASAGLFDGTAPDIQDEYDVGVLDAIYDGNGIVIWPGRAA